MKQIFGILFIFLIACSKKQETIKPSIKPLMEAVYASGFVVSEQEYQIFSQADGVLKDILVNEGETIKLNQPLLVIEGAQQSARYAIAKETYEQAKRNATPILEEAKAAMASAQTKMNFDSINFQRFKNLFSAGATTRSEYDRAEIQFENSKNDFQVAKNRFLKTKNEIEMGVINAQNQLKIAEEESGNYSVRSEIDGMVFKINKEKGELVRRGEQLGILGKPNNFYLKLTIDELDIQRVKERQDVVIKIDAYPEKVFKGKVLKVYPLIDTRQQSLRVDASLIDELPGLFSGLALEANIIIREKKDALVIPKLALLPGDSVLVMNNNVKSKIKVSTGIETLEEVEITNGLSSDSNIILNL
jgi:HlyD family secretion protein